MQMNFKGWVFARQYEWDAEPTFDFVTNDMSNDVYTKISEHTITVDVPDYIDMRALKLASLEATKRKLMAEFQARLTELEAQISKCTAIEASMTPVEQDPNFIPF